VVQTSITHCRAADWGGRLILNKALSQSPEAGKLYAVRWLGVLARIRAPSFAQYGVEFLVEQLRDPSLQVISLPTLLVF
jgi:hypothetical protein